MHIHFVAVNYRTNESALGFCKQFTAASPPDGCSIGVTLVDNSPAGESATLAAALAKLPLEVGFHGRPENLGYFRGAAFGVAAAERSLGALGWVVVSNVDVEFDVASFCRVLMDFDPARVAVVAPSIRSSLSGRDLNPYFGRRPSRIRMQFYKWLWKSYWLSTAYSFAADFRAALVSRVRAAAPPAAAARIYAAHGSIFALSSGFFATGGSLEHGPFLYGEEFTVAEHARRAGLDVVYTPSIRVVHFEHQSTAKLPSRQKWRFLREATGYCADRYF